MANITAGKCFVWKMLVKTCQIMVTIIKSLHIGKCNWNLEFPFCKWWFSKERENSLLLNRFTPYFVFHIKLIPIPFTKWKTFFFCCLSVCCFLFFRFVQKSRKVLEVQSTTTFSLMTGKLVPQLSFNFYGQSSSGHLMLVMQWNTICNEGDPEEVGLWFICELVHISLKR